MPELPEVETVMRALRARLEGRVILRAEIRRDLRWPVPPALAPALAGARVEGFRRRGKYMLMRLSGGRSVLIHLGMSGRMRFDDDAGAGAATAPVPHEHAVLHVEGGLRVGMVDPRRFGALDLLDTADEAGHRLLAGLGVEPLGDGFDGRALAALLEGSRTPLKAALLDQRRIAGLGNIYVCEALFRARLSPGRAAGSVGAAGARTLAASIRATLTEAIEAGGSSLRDYVQPDGELGMFQHRWKVYGREGAPCERCPGPPGCRGIARTAQAGRSTFLCARTQR